MTDLKRRLRDIEGYSPPDLWEEIASREPRALSGEPGPARKPVVVVLALAMSLAGLVLVMRAFGGRESRPASQPPPDVARVVCLEGAIRVETAVVRAHADVARVVFENPGELWGFEFHPESFEYGSAMGDSFGGDIKSQSTWALPPGEVTVACLPGARVAYFEPEAEKATLNVVDPEGLYVPWELACGEAERFRLRLAAPQDGDPEQVFPSCAGGEAVGRAPEPPLSRESAPLAHVGRLPRRGGDCQTQCASHRGRMGALSRRVPRQWDHSAVITGLTGVVGSSPALDAVA